MSILLKAKIFYATYKISKEKTSCDNLSLHAEKMFNASLKSWTVST